MSDPQHGRPDATDSEDKDQVKRTRPSRLPETDPALNNPDSTPGTGMLPSVGEEDTNVQPSS